MSKLPRISGKECVKALEKIGFYLRGDYTKDRETLLKQVTRESFWQDLATLRAEKTNDNYRPR
ncbi:type II toxin-antitoxin system HicA family toxin [Planktothrix sp.]|uniref:type II toxin-antitoxin system HicA family toxin n=1 Tax=Planktothrix sp. TaxID=3088171 RepID=UPI0038D39934